MSCLRVMSDFIIPNKKTLNSCIEEEEEEDNSGRLTQFHFLYPLITTCEL